jgi:hypothetical protein
VFDSKCILVVPDFMSPRKTMKIYRSMCLLLVGGIFGALISDHFHAPAVHAQDQFSSLAGCISAVPKAWGDFVGASSYGLAFRDSAGTLRFLQHPLCGSSLSITTVPDSAIDLQVQRR